MVSLSSLDTILAPILVVAGVFLVLYIMNRLFLNMAKEKNVQTENTSN